MDEIFYTIIGFGALGLLFAPLILSLIAMSRTGQLKRRIAVLDQRLAAFEARTPVAPEPARPAEAPPQRVWDAATRAADAPAEPEEPPPQPAAEETKAGEPPAEEPPVEAIAAAEAAAPEVKPEKAGIEERLTSRWLVWLGAVALVLAGIFLIKYSIDNQLLTPAMRAALGLLLGVVLTLAGEWMRRRPFQKAIATIKPDYVPGALTSAGLFISFASIYAAYALLDLIGPTTAFVGLALVALVAFALAALHSPIVAIIGLLAGFVTPALISSNEPSVWLLFGYLALIVTAAYAVVVYRAWGWLAYGATIGALLWVALWTMAAMSQRDIIVLAIFMAGVTAAAVWLSHKFIAADAPTIWDKPHSPQGPEANAWIAATGSVILFAAAAEKIDAPSVTFAIAALAAVALAYGGRVFQRFDGLMAHAAVIVLATLCVWDPAGILGQLIYDESGGNIVAPIGALWAPEAQSFVLLHLAGAAIIAALGFWLLRGAHRPYVWAGLSLVGVFLILAAGYARSRFFTTDTLWAIVAAFAAALAVFAVTLLIRHREDRPHRLALGFYAAAAIAGISFTFAFIFREAWLTVALAIQLPALAWLEKSLDLKELRRLALVIAAAILIRLAFNPYVLSYDATHALGNQWVLYGYGLPAIAFFAAARMFKQTADDYAVKLLESGAFVFALLLISLEIRILVEGRIAAEKLTLFELALHSIVWLGAGWWRLRNWRAGGYLVDQWWSAILIGLGLAAVILGQVFILNPLFSSESVGKYPIVNALLAAYLAPAILIALVARELGGIPKLAYQRIGLFALSLGLVMIWLTLETKRFFQGEVLSLWPASDAEYYAYSVVWLLSAFVLLGLGMWLRTPWLRHGAIAILLLTICKVFLSDMAALGGLYRVASFLGLGLCLVGIGYVYQRFIFTGLPKATQGKASGDA